MTRHRRAAADTGQPCVFTKLSEPVLNSFRPVLLPLPHTLLISKRFSSGPSARERYVDGTFPGQAPSNQNDSNHAG